MQISIKKDQLIKIVSTCQQRSYAQQIDLLQELGGNNIQWMVKGVCSHEKNGISNDQVELQKRKNHYGNNQQAVSQPAGLLQLFCEALQDFTMRILIVAALFSIALQVGTAPVQEKSKAWVDGFAILMAVFFCSSITAINDYQKQRQFLKLNAVADEKKKVSAIRNNILMEVHQDFILVGDIVLLTEGMEIPADGILIEANQITTDQSAMTGETQPIKKNLLKHCIKKKQSLEKSGEKNLANKHEIPSPIMLSGTKILTGQGKMMIVVVGAQSCIGKIRTLIAAQDPQPTPLQQKLQQLATDIGRFGLYSACIIVLVLVTRFLITKGTTQNWQWSAGKDIDSVLKFLLVGITVVVVAIPQGLPLSVTISLAFSVKKMLNDQNLVRKMQACETMGGANNICSDKTGTLTMNKMTLTQIWNAGLKSIDTYKEKYEQSELSNNKQFNQLFKISSLVNSSAHLQPEEKGSSTQIALLKYCKKMNADYKSYRQNFQAKIKMPFSSGRKRMSIVVQHKGSATLFIKGASEIVLSSSTQWFNSQTGQIESITPSIKKQLDETINKMAEGSLRTLCLCYKKLSAHDDLQLKDQKGVFECEKKNLILLAVIGVKDIPRKQVPDSIRQCHKAGITVRMVTGDNIITAKAIAKEIGLVSNDKQYLAMQGPEFSKLVGGIVCAKCRTYICDCPIDSSKAEQGQEVRVDTVANAEQFDKIKDKLLVLARSRPQDKYCLVAGLKERGNVVAVTGDGTNDAPALKKADVGFAMGISGTQVARGAASIILIDDNFASIVKAVLWGRNIFDSIRKFVQFQLTVNIVAVLVTFVSASVLQKQLIRPIQLLWINLIMDTFASLALATEDPDPKLLERAPHKRDQYIISKTMLKHIIGQAIFQFTALMILLFLGERFIPQYVDSYDTGIFADHPQYKWHNGVVGGTVRSGRFYTVSGDSDYDAVYQATKIYSRHFTFIYNSFVMMQVFNFLNSRKLHEQINVFQGIGSNPLFLVMVSLIFVCQSLLLTFSGSAFGVYNNFGLTIQQWGLTILIGSISIIWSLFLKALPIARHEHQHEETGGLGNKVGQFKRKSVLSLKRIEQRIQRDLAKNHPLR